jgi:hypothetical protein
MSANGNQTIQPSRNGAPQTALREAIRTLVAQSSARNYEVRVAALETISECSIEFEGVVRRAMRDRNEIVRINAMEIVAEMTLIGLKDEVVRHFTTDRSPLVRSYAAIALGDMFMANPRKILEQRIRDSNEHVRASIYYALVKLGSQKYLKHFLNGLNSPTYQVRCFTANLLTSLVDNSDKTLIVRFLREALEREKTVAARSSIKDALSQIAPKRRSPQGNHAR